MTRNLKTKKGQNTAEYLILLILVAIGSIGAFSVFGGKIKSQVSYMVNYFTGSTAPGGAAASGGAAAPASGNTSTVDTGDTSLNLSGGIN